MADKKRADIVHYGSSRCHHGARHVMVAKGHKSLYAVDIAVIARDTLNELLNRSVEMETFVYRRSLLNVAIKHQQRRARIADGHI